MEKSQVRGYKKTKACKFSPRDPGRKLSRQGMSSQKAGKTWASSHISLLKSQQGVFSRYFTWAEEPLLPFLTCLSGCFTRHVSRLTPWRSGKFSWINLTSAGNYPVWEIYETTVDATATRAQGNWSFHPGHSPIFYTRQIRHFLVSSRLVLQYFA